MFVPAGIEQRQHPRKVVNIEIHFSCNDNSQGKTVLVHDLSLSGMAIRTHGLSINKGDKVCICLSEDRINCGSEHVIEATVVHLRDGIAGLRFESVGIYVLKDIQQLLHEERTF